MRGENEDQLEVFRLGSDTPLGFKVSSTIAGTVQVGDARPKLSPDSRWLAYGLAGRLWLAPIDGSQPPQQLTKFDKGEVDLLLGGWSPDGQTLLFHQGKRMSEDEVPFPAGLSEGFYLLHLADKRVSPIPSLKGFDVWDSDSRYVYYVRARADRGYDMVRADTQGGPEVVMQQTADTSGFGQLARCGKDLAYLLMSRIERSRPDGSALSHVTPQGAFADYQQPTCSPDGSQVAYVHSVESAPNSDFAVEVTIAGGGTKSLHRCKGGCQKFGWESPTNVLVLDSGEVRRFGIDGSTATVATGVADLVLPDP